MGPNFAAEMTRVHDIELSFLSCVSGPCAQPGVQAPGVLRPAVAPAEQRGHAPEAVALPHLQEERHVERALRRQVP